MFLKHIKSGAILGLLCGIFFLFVEDITGFITLKSDFTLPQLYFSLLLYSILFVFSGLGCGIAVFILRRFRFMENITISAGILYLLSCFSVFFFAYKNVPYKIFPTLGKMQLIVAAGWMTAVGLVFLIVFLLMKRLSRKDQNLFSLNMSAVSFGILIFTIVSLKIASSPDAGIYFSSFELLWRLDVILLSLSVFYLTRFFLSKFASNKYIGNISGFAGKNLTFGASFFMVFIIITYFISSGTNSSNSSGEKKNTDNLPPNIVFILNDALRADHLSLYGYERQTSKNIDKAAERGVVFRNALSASSWTKPSMGSLFTGNYPGIHGVDSWTDILPGGLTTIAEVLSDNGYHTAGFSANPFITMEYNYAQGFDEFYYSPGNGYKQLFFPNDVLSSRIPGSFEKAFEMNLVDADCAYGNAHSMNKKIIPWLEANHDSHFFLYLHYMDPHVPYNPTNKKFSAGKPLGRDDLRALGAVHNPEDTVSIDDKLMDKIISRYDDEIIDLDNKIGEVFQTLTKYNLWDNTLVIITADHGDEFGDHGFGGHGHSMFQELIHVPLIFIFPNDEYGGMNIGRRVELIDLFPTISDFTGAKPDSRYDGFSLLPLINGDPEIYNGSKKEYFGEYSPVEEQWPISSTYAVVDSGVKYLHSTFKQVTRLDRFEMYDLSSDPEEQLNIVTDNPDTAAKLALKLKEYQTLCDSVRYDIDDLDLNNLSEEQLNRLKALGYIK